MKKYFKVLNIALVTTLMSGCASVTGNQKPALALGTSVTPAAFKEPPHIGSKRPKETSKKIALSGVENVSLSSEFFTLIDFTFENKSSDWRRIQSVQIDFGSAEANKEIRFPVGRDLMEWADSANRVNEIRNYNMQMALGSVAGMGAASAAASSSARRSGTAVAAGSGMTLAANNISSKLGSLQSSGTLPKDHLLSGPISIPPGLHSKKWITLYTRNPNKIPFISKLALTLKYEDGSTEALMLNFRTATDIRGSQWQRKHPTVLKNRESRF